METRDHDIQARLIRIEEKLNVLPEISRTLNGHNGNKGLKTRMELVEQRGRSWTWNFRMIWGAVVVGAINAIWVALRGK